MGTSGTRGVLKGRLRSGEVRRSTHTPPHTMTKASSVPMETSSPSRPMGNTPAMTQATAPVMSVATYGVRNLGCTLPNSGGKRPSRDML